MNRVLDVCVALALSSLFAIPSGAQVQAACGESAACQSTCSGSQAANGSEAVPSSSCASTCASPAGSSTCGSPTGSSTCGSPTGSSACGSATLLTDDPVTTLGPRTGSSPADLGLEDLESILEPIRKVFRVPGLAGAVVKDGRLAAIGAAGIRRVGFDQRLEIDDPFHLGSCGKAVTATVAAMAVERGMVDWTTTIEDVYPELVPTMQSYFQDVTLRDLLAHRGGFGGRGQVFDSDIALFGGDLPHQRAELVRYSVARTPAYEPGTRFGYSDIGYSIGGAMIGKRAERPFEQLVRDLLAEPLNLESLGFGAPGLEDPDSATRGHIAHDGSLVALGVGPGQDLANPAIGPAGTIHMNLRDWSEFAMFHLKGARGEHTDLLSPAGFQALHSDTFAQGYGLGWFLTANKWGNGRALTHTGSCGAWSALIWILPEENAAILVTTNFGGGSGYQALQLAADKLGHGFIAERAAEE